MQWDTEASKRLDRVPFFIRKKVKSQIEAYAKTQGKDFVDSVLVSEARQQLTGENRLSTSKGFISEEEIEKIAELIEKGVIIEGLNTKYIKFAVCGGAAGCPLTLFDIKKLSQKFSKIVKESGLEEFLRGSHDGPVLFHHQFKIALAGCPNNCSQPQIADFAVVGQAKPYKLNDKCNQCNLCVEACKENAVTVDGSGPSFDYEFCLNCGDCARYCKHEVIADTPVNYQILIGGKLGRHPHLAVTLTDLVDEKEVEKLLMATIDFYKSNVLDGKRFSDLPVRLGADNLIKGILEQLSVGGGQ